MTPDNENDMIYYTTDGTNPDSETSNQYNGSAILIQEDTTLKLIAIKENYIDSDIITYNYLIDEPLQLSLGENHACVLLEGGKINCWGNNEKGQLGNGTNDLSNKPVLVLEINTAIQVSIGFSHSCALLDTKDVMCWGNNEYGQLGFETPESLSLIPVVIPEFGEVNSIAVGGNSSCAIDSANKLYCWGDNSYGQLGVGDKDHKDSPTFVLSDVISVDIGITHACAVLTDGNVMCWGDNTFGQLGTEDTISQLSPVQINAPISMRVSVGDNHSCLFIQENNSAFCAGNNEFGKLGSGAGDLNIPVFVPVVGLTNIQMLDVGKTHSCAIYGKEGFTQSCWGSNNLGQLGLESKDELSHNVPESMKNMINQTNTSLGYNFTCSIVDPGSGKIKELYCWGSNDKGKLGVDSGDPVIETPTKVEGLLYSPN